MWTKIGTAAILATVLAGTAATAFAQGSITQDPGRITPGNLITGRLGPSTSTPAPGENGSLGAGAIGSGR